MFFMSLFIIDDDDDNDNRYLVEEDIPDNFSWDDVDGKSYLTKHLNRESSLIEFPS